MTPVPSRCFGLVRAADAPTTAQTHPRDLHGAAGTCGGASPAARSLSAGLAESEMPLSFSAAGGSSPSESEPQVESHSSMVLGSLNRQLPSKFPIETVTQQPLSGPLLRTGKATYSFAFGSEWQI